MKRKSLHLFQRLEHEMENAKEAKELQRIEKAEEEELSAMRREMEFEKQKYKPQKGMTIALRILFKKKYQKRAQK